MSSAECREWAVLARLWALRWGWHRVTFYGDLTEPVYARAGTAGWKVLEGA